MKVLLIEDEAAAARRLEKLIKEIDPKIEICAHLDSIESTLLWIDSNPFPDLIFLDIHLADGSSFEIFRQTNIQKPVIFTTAYDQYALEAFQVNAVDYLLKPIKKPQLEKAIHKFRHWQENQTPIDYKKLAEAVRDRAPIQRFLIRVGQHLRVVDIKEVAYFYTESKVTFLITYSGKRYPVDQSLEKLEELLDQRSFFRINRQFLIHFDAIKEMYSSSKSRVKIDLAPPCDYEVIVSAERSPHFKKWLTGQ